MSIAGWIIFFLIVSPSILALLYGLVCCIKIELGYRKQDKIDRVESMEKLYRDCLARLDRLQLEEKQNDGIPRLS